MKRTDHDDHERQGPPPFRVLPDTAYLSPIVPTPPPPRAPEPYKVVPSATRTQRRSTSFVILAESRPISPESGNVSILPAGRISPFRGRGFKEPPPRSVSRPQSPETTANEHRRGRVERRASASEQSNSRKSLIPQPTYRQRSTSLTKVNEQSSSSLSSQKTNRRADSKTQQLNNSKSRLNVSGLQGRPNASSDSKTQSNDSRTRMSKIDYSRSRPFAEPRTRFISNSTSNLNSTTTTRRKQTTTKSLTKLSPIQGTPTKQEKTISESNAKGRISSRISSPTKTPMKYSQKNATGSNKNENKNFNNNNNNNNNNKERVVSPSKIPVKTNKTNGSSVKSAEQPSQTLQIELVESKDKNLINLLKQTATNANSTSSERLVNTTTTTAVQPLQIDAVNGVLTERNDGNPSNSKERAEVTSKSSASKDASPVPIATQSGLPPTTQNSTLLENQSAKASTSASYKKDGPKPNADGRASGSQSTAKRREDQELNSTTSTEMSHQIKSDSTFERKMAANRETSETNKTLPKVMENNPQIVANQERKTVAATAKTNDATMADKAASSNNKENSATDAEKTSVNSKGVSSKNGIRGSQGSLGSTGVSVDSIMSYKSTDTGVSLNTFVRVSSPREKVGVHVMKRPQEIKTLSGDIVREEDRESEKKRRFMASDGLKQRMRLPWWRKQRSRLRLWWIDWRNKRAQRRPTRITFEKTKTITDIPPPAAAAAAATPRSIGCRVCCCRRRASDNPPAEEPEIKLPNPLVEHNSHMRGAIPCLPLFLAWFCLVWNVLLPGTGTIWSGLFNLCFGQPRFSPVAGIKSRLGAFIINLVVGISQMFTVLFCFVGWGWSIWWGITMIRLARKYKRFKVFEANRNDAEARAGDPVAPGVPTEVLRGVEKGR
ncbi:protein stum [Pseudomyrmex gracilis]|uniref:protein stum n=1 Tax=Pseudomyrmex gracilis TaxID=219809 RepID=UPI000995CA07|nr:protein stum [Pseudomyrmex gracilis]